MPRRENRSAKRERARRIAKRLAEVYPDATCELDYRTPWQLLVATILSAQCTDKMVNQVTPALFEQFPDPSALSRAPRSKIEQLIRRTGFYSQKAKSILTCAKQVTKTFGGEVPKTIDELISLQGVGRKTASVVLGTAFGQPAVFVDTHVKRLSYRLGLTRATEPDKIENDLKTLLLPAEWTTFCHRLIHHGRRICFARAPQCQICPLLDVCPRVGVLSNGKQ
ncbi:MAG: endonuclease III [Candidatus Binatia bacterium]